jgi:uncharacterized membrane protein HdeD (DUF308 family)
MQKKDYFRFFISIILAAIGLFTLFSPTLSMLVVVIILGVIFIVWGAVMIIRQIAGRSHKTAPPKTETEQKKKELPPAVHVILAILLLAAGILLLVFSTPVKDSFMPFVFGIWALITGIIATTNAVGFKKKNLGAGFSVIALIVSYITFVILIVFSLSDPGFTASVIGGVFLLIFGAVTAIEIAMSSHKKKQYYINKVK